MNVTAKLGSRLGVMALWAIGLPLMAFSISGPFAPFLFWPDAARSLIDHTIHGHLLRPSVLWLAVLLLSAATFWMAAMAWCLAMAARNVPYDRSRPWRPHSYWWVFAFVLGATAILPMLFNSNTPGPGAQETRQYEEVCDDSGHCGDQPVLEPYRWGKPFLLRAERENIQKAIAILVLPFPAGVLAFRLGTRLGPAKMQFPPQSA